MVAGHQPSLCWPGSGITEPATGSRLRLMSNRSLRRLVRLLALVLVVVTPLLVAGYLLDQRTDAGPTLAERKLAEAEAAVRQHPDEISLRFKLAAAYLAAQRDQDAVAQYDEVLLVEPDHVAALLAKATVLQQRGDLDGAEPLYERIVALRRDGEFAKVDADLQQAYYGLGVVAVRQERFDDAVAALESAVRIDRADADAWHQLALAQLGAGSPSQAVQAERQTVMFVPTEWADPYATMAEAYTSLGETEHAEWARGMVDLVAKEYGAAKEHLLPLVDGPAAADATIGLGLVAEHEGEIDAAVAWYRKALELDPESITASWGLSRLDADEPDASDAPSTEPASGNG
jgi:tetratricopeptide (TPR) repeat protein